MLKILIDNCQTFPQKLPLWKRESNFTEVINSEISKAVWEHISKEWDMYTAKLLLHQKS